MKGLGKTVFVIGGARSGKSSFALKSANSIEGQKAYIATAQPLDPEMKSRIKDHKAERGTDWTTFEEPVDIAKTLLEAAPTHKAVLIDCLTLWLSNLMMKDADVDSSVAELILAIKSSKSFTTVFIVSNEVGMGIVPEGELARRFRDLAGRLNQRIAEVSDEAYFVAAGLPMKIK